MVNELGYADDYPLMAIVPFPGVKVKVADSQILDLDRVSEWCDLWGMILDASTTKTMLISRSRSIPPHAVSPINDWRNCAEGV